MAKNSDPFDDFINMVWANRSEGLPVTGFDLKREITPEELRYMHQKFAYMQILNPEGQGEFSDIRFIRGQSGWMILDYRNAMSTSPGEALFSDELYSGSRDEYYRINLGTGTRVKQIIDTAAEMVTMAKERNWPSIHIVNGQRLMKWGIWKASMDLDIPLTGFVPTKQDEEKYKRIKTQCPTLLISAPVAKL